MQGISSDSGSVYPTSSGSEHFRQLLLQKNHGNELKVLLDAPELFDEPADEHNNDASTHNVKDTLDDNDIDALRQYYV